MSLMNKTVRSKIELSFKESMLLKIFFLSKIMKFVFTFNIYIFFLVVLPCYSVLVFVVVLEQF